jgi:hypothetical protein
MQSGIPSLRALHRVAVVLFTLVCAGTAAAANIQEMVRETQRVEQTDGNMSFVWWLPQQFWEESMRSNPALTADARNQVLAAMSDYLIVALIHARVGPLGISDAAAKDELLGNVHLESNGKPIEPLDPAKIAPGAQVLLAQLKPAIASTAGQVGQSMEFVVFSAKADGELLIDASQPGSVGIRFYDSTFKWRLPLASLLPKRLDAKSGEEFPGNYEFNPYTGNRLKK